MELILVTIFLTAGILAYLRRQHHNLAEVKFKNRLFKLRDELRLLAINGEIDGTHWTFDYFDYSFSKAIQDSYYITLFHLFALTRRHENDKSLKNVKKKLELACNKIPHLQRLHNEYTSAVKDYILDQHKVSATFLITLLEPVFAAWKLKQKVSKAISATFFLPETSANGRFDWSSNQRPTFVGV